MKTKGLKNCPRASVVFFLREYTGLNKQTDSTLFTNEITNFSSGDAGNFVSLWKKTHSSYSRDR